MPRGDKSSYTDKQQRKAEHIEEGYKKEGVSDEEAERRAWATVNKQDGGGKLSGSGRKSARTSGAAKKTGAGARNSARKTSGNAAKKTGGARKTARKTGGSAAKKSGRR